MLSLDLKKMAQEAANRADELAGEVALLTQRNEAMQDAMVHQHNHDQAVMGSLRHVLRAMALTVGGALVVSQEITEAAAQPNLDLDIQPLPTGGFRVEVKVIPQDQQTQEDGQ